MGLGEFERIDRYFRPLATAPDALDLTDDAAVLAVADLTDLVVSTDAIVEGIHFRPDDPTCLVARKALRTNLSDLAAMGAAPWLYTLVLAIRAESTTDLWLEQLATGLAQDQEAFAVRLTGGDLVGTTGPAMLSVTIFGKQHRRRVIRRNSACSGDDLYVSGTIGDAALGLKALNGEIEGLAAHGAAELIDRYHLPRPRITLGLALAGTVTAGMDVSDGLVQDLGHLCRASGVAACIRLPQVPLSLPARALLESGQVDIEDILGGGDDYELLFTAAPDKRDVIADRAAAASTPVTRIGVVSEGAGVDIRDAANRSLDLQRTGWRHG